MATDHIRYDVLTRDALRGVLRRVLSDAAAHGLPGEHHFFITFLSTAEGVKLSPRLLAQYPDEMTIILQHQFWDLLVHEDRFEVGLSFGGIPERLAVPFAAIKSFFDPSVQFGLQFETTDVDTEAGAEVPAKNLPAAPAASALAPSTSQPAASEKADEPAKPADRRLDHRTGLRFDGDVGDMRPGGAAAIARADYWRLHYGARTGTLDARAYEQLPTHSSGPGYHGEFRHQAG